MKKLLISSLLLASLAIFAACGSADNNNDNNNNTAQQASYNPLKDPVKIEGLYVGTCKELFADMRKNDKKSAGDELYRVAAVILFSDKRDEEAKTCCDNIKDEKLKKECRKE